MGSVSHVLWQISWQVAILGAVVWVATKFARKAPASWRHVVWLIVLVKFFIPPFAQVPAHWVSWVNTASAPIVTTIAQPSTSSALSVSVRGPAPTSATNPPVPSANVAAGFDSAKPAGRSLSRRPQTALHSNAAEGGVEMNGVKTSSGKMSDSAQPQVLQMDWIGFAGVCWLMGIALTTALLVSRCRRLNAVTKTSRATDGHWAEMLVEAESI